jgi:hypothetical protein
VIFRSLFTNLPAHVSGFGVKKQGTMPWGKPQQPGHIPKRCGFDAVLAKERELMPA